MFHYQFVRSNGLFQLPPSFAPYKCVILIERTVSAAFREAVSRKLVETGCLYAMAWGEDCSLWDDSVDHAVLDRFGYGDIPDAQFVLTTWHENDPIEDVFFFARCVAMLSYADVELSNLLALDIAPSEREDEIRKVFDRS